MKELVTLGTYGQINSLFESQRSHYDLAFITKEGVELKCHRFVIGAQSTFLKTLLLEPSASVIHLPDVDSRCMKIILEFLYTGNLVIEGEDVSEIKDLMSRILCLNARVYHFEEKTSRASGLEDVESLEEEEDEEEEEDPSSLENDSRRPIIPQKPSSHRRKKKRIRKYSFCPFTITGVYKASTLRALNQKSGSFTCHECDITYDKEASLRRHRSRTHNTNLREECPICRKRLSTKSTLNKHLISHQPRSQWPFECPLCKQEFQCKADIPKHLMTSKHKDVELPPMGSDGWIELINSSARVVSIKEDEEFVGMDRGSFRSLESDEEDPLSI